MPYKPMKRRDYERWLREYGWSLEKGAIDWNLMDEQGHKTGTAIKITHPGGEVTAQSVKKTEIQLKQRGKKR